MTTLQGADWVDAEVAVAIQGVLHRIFHDAEVQRVWIDDETFEGIFVRPGAFAETWLHLIADGERFDFRLWTADSSYPPESPSDLRDRLGSDLQDWIAESRFGWGQWRPL